MRILQAFKGTNRFALHNFPNFTATQYLIHTSLQTQDFTGSTLPANSTQPIAIEEQFRIMADTAPVLIWISGTDKLCYFFNQGWLRFTGRTLEQEWGNGWAEGVHPDDFERCLHIYTTNFDARKEFKMEYRLRRHDGVYRWLLDHGVPRYTASGEFAGYIGSCIDVEEKNVIEVALEQRVGQRTAELQKAVRELKRSNEELEQFAYAASHDMKEPIRKIKIFSEAILSRPENKEQGVAKIQEAANRVTALIDNLLNLSTVRKIETFFEPVALNEILAQVKADLDLSIAEKGAFVYSDDLPVVQGMREQLHQLFFNLLGNALKYTRKGVPPQIHITVLRHATHQDIEPDAQREYIEIAVRDNGIGFRPEDAERIFTVFQRLHAREVFPGTGIGLALCKKIVQNHEGFIYAEGQPEHGATFHIVLPV